MRRALGFFLVPVFALCAGGQIKEKRTYELIYQDVQQLKQQVLRVEKKLDETSAGLKLLGDQVRDLSGQFKLFQNDQARSQEGLKALPGQYQIFLEKLEQIESQLLKISEDLVALKSRPEAAVGPAQEEPKKEEKTPAAKRSKEEKKPESAAEKKERSVPPVQPNLSPQEVYNTAYADYQKGNYDLAIDGFTLYRDQFPASPLADNALFMIGECCFSQKKFDKAIEDFDELIMNYPLSDKIATAYWKKALSLIEMKKTDEAVAVLRLLITKFPLEEEAKSAQQKIQELRGKK